MREQRILARQYEEDKIMHTSDVRRPPPMAWPQAQHLHLVKGALRGHARVMRARAAGPRRPLLLAGPRWRRRWSL